jgi:hypothetical protein
MVGPFAGGVSISVGAVRVGGERSMLALATTIGGATSPPTNLRRLK